MSVLFIRKLFTISSLPVRPFIPHTSLWCLPGPPGDSAVDRADPDPESPQVRCGLNRVPKKDMFKTYPQYVGKEVFAVVI